MVNVPWDVKKINSVYSWYGGGDDGIKAVYKEISQLVGFEPDYQVVVEWDAVGEIVDAMGGVYFDVPYNMNYHDPYQDLVIEQAKGYRLLTGDDAMQVIRWRHNDDGTGYPNSDLGRIQTQQNFLKSVIKQLLQLKNVTKIGEFAEVFQNNVETDMAFQEMLWFGQQAVLGGLSLENIEFVTMPNKITSAYSRTVSKVYGRDMNQSYVVPKANELLELVNTSLSPFVEKSTFSDLDIMSVNRDGSVSSSTGYVEDKAAALPPVKIGKPEEEAPAENETPVGEPLLDENGEPVLDPVTGEPVMVYPGEDAPDIIVIPGEGEAAEPANPEAPVMPEEPSAPTQQPEAPTPPAPVETPVPETPSVSEPPAEEPGFIIMEPEPVV
jgi:LCP family protein required for cell wall assembly